ncbi:hypothetical protein HDU88_008915 [Geranomyces variabilis]|nr:hypothetical protein HDU88_008915 [Geranomyces variabilis]
MAERRSKDPFLPLEIVLLVIDRLTAGIDAVALKPSHRITRTLLALTRCSRSVKPIATKYLYRHCLFIDSAWRLAALNQTLASAEDEEDSVRQHMTALYVAPFQESIDDPVIAFHVHELFRHLGSVLTRLVIDMPLRSLYPEDDVRQILPLLRKGFDFLKVIEEFTSARDELHLSNWPKRDHPPFWARWPRLRRLALYNMDLDPNVDEFWSGIAKLGGLEVLVATRADGLDELSCDILRSRARRPHRLIFVNLPLSNRFDGPRWDHLVANLAGPYSDMVVLSDESALETYSAEPVDDCQEWTRDRALSGELWAGGTPIHRAPRF